MSDLQPLTIAASAEGGDLRLTISRGSVVQADVQLPRWESAHPGSLAMKLVSLHLGRMIQDLEQNYEGPFVIRIEPSTYAESMLQVRIDDTRYGSVWRGDCLADRAEAHEWAALALRKIIGGGAQSSTEEWKLSDLRAEAERDRGKVQP